MPERPAQRRPPRALSSRDRRQLLAEARTYLAGARYAEADAIYLRLVEVAPDNGPALLGRLAVARMARQPAEILARCEEASAALPDRLDIRRYAVDALLKLNRLPEAKRALLAMASLDRAAADTHVAAAAYARARGDHEASLRHTQALMRLRPGDVRLALQASRDLGAMGRAAEGLEQLEPFLGERPDHAQLLVQAGELARLAGRNEEAERHYAGALALRPDHAKTLLAHAEICLILGRDTPAEASLDRAAAADAPGLTTLLRLSNGFRLLGRLDKARNALEQAGRQFPDRPEAWLQLARLAAQNGAPDAALTVLWRARPLTGDAVPMLLAEASLLFGQGLREEADACFERARQLHPADPAVVELTLDRAIAMGRFATALEAAGRLPDQTSAEHARRSEAAGRIAEAQRDHAAAHELFRKAAAQSPTLAAAHEGLARTSLALLRPKEALASLETSLELQAAALKVRGRMAVPTRGVLGELINETLIHELPVEAGRMAVEEGGWPDLLRAHRAAPDLTILAIAVLTKLRRQGSLDLSSPLAGVPTIPRRIHQFWNGPVVPPDVAELMESWPGHNPGWEYRRYGLDDAADYLGSRFPPEVARAFRRAWQPAQQADLFRLAMLLAEGGVYADADDRCIAPLDAPLANADLLLWQEPFGSIGNSFIAAMPGHPVIEAALVQATEATLRGDAETLWLSTGPGLLSRALVQYLTGDGLAPAPGQRIVVLERWDLREFCMPCCKAAYKAGGRHWFAQEAAAQPS